MKTLTKNDIPHFAPETIDLPGGLKLRIETAHDDSGEAPWDNDDGRGIVSEWTTRDKKPGERILATDGRSHRFYDFAATIEKAKRDGWDAEPYKTGTKGERAVRAVEADFEFLRAWCADEWEYLGVIVTLTDKDGRELACDSCWGVESFDGYWREMAAELGNGVWHGYVSDRRKSLRAAAKERRERAFWEARDTVTV